MIEHAAATVATTLSSPQGLVALVAVSIASALIVTGTFVKTMLPLRWLTVGSNVGFLIYGALFPSLPMLLLHATLLPINIYRAAEMVRLTRRVRGAIRANDTSGLWLRPYMTSKLLKAGEIVFRKGDVAGHLYMLASGRIELVEIGVTLNAGRVFGEIAFFAPDRRRTQTARCLEPCQLLSINESTVRQLFYQNPEFGFEVIGLVAGRLSADVQRLQAEVAARVAEAGGHNGAMQPSAPVVASAAAPAPGGASAGGPATADGAAAV